MYLKKIKIFGFKSFADEIIFDFSQGITAIVGPNGCGKSNVMDAFNWVLGEQSATRLRSNHMQDIIFHGSRTRKPLGVAAVELCLDNSMDLLSIDYDEVTIQRKLYRSGESEYFINKNPCRLKDIKELFLDTGIGTRSYSIMEQDNIKYILESSPLDRRSIIEEAAGIRKYKEKKSEAERRLERIRSDLNEVKNIMGEVQKNIRRLKRQTQRAGIYKEVKQKIWFLEVSRLCQEYVKISGQLGSKLKETASIEEEITLHTSEKDKFDAKISKLENNKMEIDEKLLNDNRNIYQIESRIEIINNRIENFASSVDQLDEEIRRHKENYEYNNNRIKELGDELARADESNIKDKEIESKSEELENQRNKIKHEHQKKIEEIESLTEKIEKDEEELFELRQREIKGKLSLERLKELQGKKTELENTADLLKKKMEQKNGLLKNLEEKLNSYTLKIEESQNKFKNINLSIEKEEETRESLLTKYHSTKSQFDAGKKYLPQLISIEELARKKFKGIYGPIFTLLEKTDIKKLSKVIGEKMGWILTENRDSAIAAIAYLKDKNLPPLTFILKDHVPDVKVTYKLPENISRDIKNILKYFIQNLKIDGDLIWRSSCIISGGGEIPPRGQLIMGLENVVEEMEEKLKNSEKLINNLKCEKGEIQNLTHESINNRNSLQNEISPIREQIGHLTGNYKYISNELKKIKGITSEEIKEKDIGQVSDLIVNLRNKLDQQKQLLKEKQEDYSRLRDELAKLDVKISTLNDVLSHRKENMENILQRKNQLRDDTMRIKTMISDLEYKKEYQAKQNEKDLNDIKRLSSEKKVLMAAIGETENVKGGLVEELKNLKEVEKTLEIKLEKLKNTVGEQKQREERLKERVNSINVRLSEDMNIKLDEALKDYDKDTIDEGEIANLKEKLSKIGEVNLEAPKEYEKEYQRYEFILRHVNDLEEADGDLKSIIRKIDRQTRDKFFDTFNEINENFKQIFRKLFEGGRAELKLTEPDNILESGIEIQAQPEGKNISSIIQLSGGESALCAIALMFAIYEVKPTPFCILDEVDSPLDDSNLHRFLRMLRDYLNSTQFIIVTHNKHTMEMCDTFYGITMEEFGVSKIISVKIKDAKAAELSPSMERLGENN